MALQEKLVALVLILAAMMAQVPRVAAEPATMLHDDPAGDVAWQGLPDAVPTGPVAQAVDLLALAFAETTASTLVFSLQFASAEHRYVDEVPASAPTEVHMQFQFGDLVYATDPGSSGGGSCSQPTPVPVSVVRLADGQVADTFCVQRESADDGWLHLTMPRDRIVNENHVPIARGDTLTNFTAEARSSWVRSPTGPAPLEIEIWDRVPNEAGSATWTSAMGTAGSGHLTLTSKQPLRVSNGEATTILYTTVLANAAPFDDVVFLAIESQETSFDVTVPESLLVPAGAAVTVPVVISMGFEHRHGQTGWATVSAQSTKDPNAVTSLDVGVHWVEVAQPSGHHPNVYLHSAPATTSGALPDPDGPDVHAWFNTLEPEQDIRDVSVDVPPYSRSNPGLDIGETLLWRLPLEPLLQVGLAPDNTTTGRIDFAIVTDVPVDAAEAHASLYWTCPFQEGVSPCDQPNMVYGTALASGQQSLGTLAPGTHSVSIDLAANPAISTVPSVPGARLYLDFQVILAARQVDPLLSISSAGGTLPLREYHDEVDPALRGQGDFRLEAPADIHRLVNPGGTAVLSFALVNAGDDEARVSLDVVGYQNEWIRPIKDIHVGPGETSRVDIVVEAPTQAVGRADLFLIARVSTPVPQILAAPFSVVVTTDQTIASDELPWAAKQSPGGSGLAIVLALAALAMRRRMA